MLPYGISKGHGFSVVATEVRNLAQRSASAAREIKSLIATASEEQRAGIEQVNNAIVEMDRVTQQNAALVEEATAAAQSMQDQAGQLAQVVGTFKLEHAGMAPRAQAGARAQDRIALPA